MDVLHCRRTEAPDDPEQIEFGGRRLRRFGWEPRHVATLIASNGSNLIHLDQFV